MSSDVAGGESDPEAASGFILSDERILPHTVLYDHRELRSTIPGLLALAGVPLEKRQLLVGDYILSERLIVERKSANDLVASIKDRRLWEQAERLKRAYPLVVLIIEGADKRFPEESWKGAVASVLTMGVSVLQTANDLETAEWIARLARRETKGPARARGSKRKSGDADRLTEDVLASLPGISGRGAKRLLEHYGCLSKVFTATETELRTVTGIGPKRAKGLALLFARHYNARPGDPLQ